MGSVAVVLLIVALLLQGHIKAEKQTKGIPEGLVLYSDLNVPAQPLFSSRLRLSGKPDYILKRESGLVPVEVKTGRHASPQKSHVLQLATYCMLLEETSGEYVHEGILVYNTVPYTIPFDPKLRFELESVIKSMRAALRTGVVKSNHEESSRCRRCSMKEYCSYERQ